MNQTKLFWALILGLAVAFVMILWPVTAQEEDSPPPVIDLNNPEAVLSGQATFTSPIELVERRTATAKHFQIGPTMYQAKISAVPLHYRDSGGNWQEINLNFFPQLDGSFHLTHSLVKLHFPMSLKTEGFSLSTTVYMPTPTPQNRHQNSAPLNNGKPDLTQWTPQPLTQQQSERTATPLALSLTWQPEQLTFVDGTPYADFSDAVATLLDGNVVYGVNTATLSFTPLSIGFEHRLTLSTPLTMAHGDLLYTTTLTAPLELLLTGLTLLSQTDDDLLSLLTPYLVDQTGATIQVSYRLETSLSGIKLVLVLPDEWLSDSARQYPVTMASAVLVPQAIDPVTTFNVSQAAQIWECQLEAGQSNDNLMRVGRRSQGDCVAGVERALVQWDISSLPSEAVLGFDESPETLVGQTETRLWRYPISGTGSSAVNIGTHRLLVPWTAAAVSWQNRTISDTWSNSAGGDSNDYLATAEDEIGISAAGAPGYDAMGSVSGLVGAWKTNRLFFDELTDSPCARRDVCFGTPNYGVMYRATDESGATELDRAFARAMFTTTAPILAVSYFTNTPLVPPTNNPFPITRAPSPDYFQFQIPANNWSAIAIKPTGDQERSDYDLILSDQFSLQAALSPENSTTRKISQQRGTKPDFIVMSPFADTGIYLRTWAIQTEGTGPYLVHHINRSSNISLGASVTVNLDLNTILKMYEFDLEAGNRYEINIRSLTGDADVGLALFEPATKQAFALNNAIEFIDETNFGQNERFVYEPSTSGRFGLAVLNNGLGESSTATLNLSVNRYINTIHLPSIVKLPTPTPTPTATPVNEPTPTPTTPPPLPENSDFENGLTVWTPENPGPPLLANVVANPDGNCFSGSFVAQLGTPSGPTELFNSIPTDREVSIEQQLQIPANATTLGFTYKVNSYDIARGAQSGNYFDYFYASIRSVTEPPLQPDNAPTGLLTPPERVGNPAGSLPPATGGTLTLWESGCQQATVDISQFAGQQVVLRFAVRNGSFNDRNTWAIVDEIEISRSTIVTGN